MARSGRVTLSFHPLSGIGIPMAVPRLFPSPGPGIFRIASFGALYLSGYAARSAPTG